MYDEFFILQNGDMSESSLVSDTVDLVGIKSFKIVVYWENGAGLPSGVLSLESSTDGINYETILESEQAIQDSSGFHLWDFPYNPVTLLRVKYLKTSGTGTMTMLVQVGG